MCYLDIHMPMLSRFEAPRFLRRTSVHVVMMMPLPNLENVRQAAKMGVGSFLVKTFHTSQGAGLFAQIKA